MTVQETSKEETVTSLFDDVVTLDPSQTTEAWERLNKSIIADAISRLPRTVHESLMEALSKRIVSCRMTDVKDDSFGF